MQALYILYVVLLLQDLYLHAYLNLVKKKSQSLCTQLLEIFVSPWLRAACIIACLIS